MPETEQHYPEHQDRCNGGMPDGYVHQHVGRCYETGWRHGYDAARREQALAEFAAAEHIRAHRIEDEQEGKA